MRRAQTTDLTCALCKRPVDNYTIEIGVYDLVLGQHGTRVTAYCHGDQARCVLPLKDEFGQRLEVPATGIAFGAPNDFYNRSHHAA